MLVIFGVFIEYFDGVGVVLLVVCEFYDEFILVLGFVEFGIGVLVGRVIVGYIGV